MSTNNELRNSITEYENHYKRINPSILEAYNGLYPPMLSKVASAIFSFVVSNKFYGKMEEKKPQDKRRIYSNFLIKPEDILLQINPKKYSFDNDAMKSDVSNLLKTVSTIHDNNIFYLWKIGKPLSFMFFMERDIGCWKYYNELGVVTPKSIIKILNLEEFLIQDMRKIVSFNGSSLSEDEIRNSFCFFVKDLIQKASPDIHEHLSVFSSDNEFTGRVKGYLESLDPYHGLKESDNFLKNLPNSISYRISAQRGTKEEKVFDNTIEDTASAIVPKNANLYKIRKRRSPKDNSSIQYPKITTFKPINPLENCNDFISYYRAVISSMNNEAKFYPYDSERNYAMKILEELSINDRMSKDFLKDWISFYFENYLKGNNIKKADKTSLKSFALTFSKYNESYIG